MCPAISTSGEELEGAKLQILNKEGEILEEWVTDGKPHLVEKLPVGEELTLREITAPEGYEIAEDVEFTLEDTMEIQNVPGTQRHVHVPVFVRLEALDLLFAPAFST